VTAWVTKGRDLREYEMHEADNQAREEANDEEEGWADEAEYR
jgi:hypothetical protein